MNDFQGALGVSQMKKVDFIVEKRGEIAQKYNETLRNVDGLITPYVPENYTHGYQSYVCLFTAGEELLPLNKEKIDKLNLTRNQFMEDLETKGIATRQGTHAIHTLGYYRTKYNLKEEDYLAAYAADRLSVTLPLYAEMTEEEFESVIENIKFYLN
jgi:dTDP-4-amino-4,6-dideoxygalactose transaminase